MIRMLVLDIDRTLIPAGQTEMHPRVLATLQAAKRKGIKVVVATGRAFFALQPCIRKKLKPDYYICSNGAHLLNKDGSSLKRTVLTSEEMYALVDFCEDHDHPLAFCYDDGYYAYVEYEKILNSYGKAAGSPEHIKDGEDQDRHLQGMPFAAFCSISDSQLKNFQQKYGYLGLRFVPFAPQKYDIVGKYMDKAVGLQALLEHLEISPEEIAAVGDNHNDIEMLKTAGISACPEGADEVAKAVADRVLPPCEEGGVAVLVEELIG